MASARSGSTRDSTASAFFWNATRFQLGAIGRVRSKASCAHTRVSEASTLLAASASRKSW